MSLIALSELLERVQQGTDSAAQGVYPAPLVRWAEEVTAEIHALHERIDDLLEANKLWSGR